MFHLIRYWLLFRCGETIISEEELTDLRKIKYVSIMMILLGNMVYYGQSGFTDSQTATTVENNDLKQVIESPKLLTKKENSPTNYLFHQTL